MNGGCVYSRESNENGRKNYSFTQIDREKNLDGIIIIYCIV